MVSLLAESWTWFSIVMFVAICRIVSRRMTFGTFKRFQVDDYGIVVVLCFYTVLVVALNVETDTNSNLLPPGFDTSTLTPDDIAERVYGSKLIIVVEQCQCFVIWGAKACLIALYLRLTSLRVEHYAIKALAVFVGLSFIIMEILYFAVWCRPFWEYWAVPTNNIQCSAATNHLITNAVFNLTSDFVMLAIGLPMFLRMHLPWQKKVPLVLIFSLGIFVILAAILNKVYSFTEPFGAEWTFWYVRESSTALLVANLPFLSTLWKRVYGGSRERPLLARDVAIVSPFAMDSHDTGSSRAADPSIQVHSTTSEPMVVNSPAGFRDRQPELKSATQVTSSSAQDTMSSLKSDKSIKSFV